MNPSSLFKSAKQNVKVALFMQVLWSFSKKMLCVVHTCFFEILIIFLTVPFPVILWLLFIFGAVHDGQLISFFFFHKLYCFSHITVHNLPTNFMIRNSIKINILQYTISSSRHELKCFCQFSHRLILKVVVRIWIKLLIINF